MTTYVDGKAAPDEPLFKISLWRRLCCRLGYHRPLARARGLCLSCAVQRAKERR